MTDQNIESIIAEIEDLSARGYIRVIVNVEKAVMLAAEIERLRVLVARLTGPEEPYDRETQTHQVRCAFHGVDVTLPMEDWRPIQFSQWLRVEDHARQRELDARARGFKAGIETAIGIVEDNECREGASILNRIELRDLLLSPETPEGGQ